MAENSQQSMRRTNHTWTALEDKVLVDCLLEIGPSWKGDNGFKPGFSTAVERMMHDRILRCSLKAMPHITSRIKILKTKYNTIFEMVTGGTGSGFGWNDQTKMIEVENSVFLEWVKTHPNAKGLYMKPFPYYDQLGPIFGKDVAIGTQAQGAEESVQDLDREAAVLSESETRNDPYFDPLRDDTPTPMTEMSVPDSVIPEDVSPSPVVTSTVKKGKKRGRCDDVLIIDIGDAVKELSQSYRTANENISQLVSCFKQQTEGSKDGMSILDELKRIDGLTATQRVEFAMIIGKDNIMKDIFMHGTDEHRYAVVSSLYAKSQ